MKKLIKKLLNEHLNEIVYGGEYIVYHGTNSDIQKFSDEFVGKEEATDQEGPGIYFTTLKEESEMYGKNLYSVKLTPRKLMDMTPINKNKWRSFTTKMLQSAPDWEDTAQNFHENPKKGLILAVESMMDYNDTEKDLAQQIWYDFYRYTPVDFVRNMVEMGIDGIIVPREKSNHIIVYNPSIIDVLEVENKD
jgi:hypothetical protein